MSRSQRLKSLVVVGLICVSSTVLAQNRPPRGGFGGGLTDVLGRSDVREELEIVDDQIQDLEEVSRNIRDRTRELFSGLRDLSEEERREKFREAITKVTEETEKEIGKVLLPHQLKRAKQLAFQMRLRGGTSQALTGGELAEELGVTEKQREDLQKKAEEVEAEMRQKMAELRKEAQDKLFSVLNASQRNKLEDLIGEPFEFQRTENRFGGGQGRFGQGGQGRRGGNGGNRRPAPE